MKLIEVKLSLPVVAPLLDIIKSVADTLKTQLAVDATPFESEADMAASWSASLIETQNTGVDALLALFDSKFFQTGVVRFDPENAGQIIRACSALRLQMRTQLLDSISDDTLEQGLGDTGKLPPDMGRALMCYQFLATIQELIIQHLDKWILGEEAGM